MLETTPADESALHDEAIEFFLNESEYIKANTPGIRAYFTEDEIKQSIKNISKRLFANGLYSIVEDKSVTKARLLNSNWCWHIDSRKRVVCWLPLGDSSVYAEPTDVFPRIFLDKDKPTENNRPRQMLINAVSSEIDCLFKERNLDLTIDKRSFRDSFREKLFNHLFRRCSKLLRADGEILRWHFARKFHALLPPDVLKYALVLRGPGATALDATIIWQNLEEVRAVYQVAPSLLPIWLRWTKEKLIRSTRVSYYKHKKLQIKTWARIDSSRFQSNGVLETIKNVFEAPQIEGERLLPRAWRFMCGQTYVWGVPPARSSFLTIRAAIRWFNLISSLPIKPKYSVYKFLYSLADSWHWLTRIDIRFEEKFADNVALITAFVKMANRLKVKQLNEDLYRQFQHVLDWWFSVLPSLDANQRRASWDWFVRAQKHWHETREVREMTELQQYQWESKLQFYQEDGWAAFALTDALALYQEAVLMHHCVDEYAGNCYYGYSRIFHLVKLKDVGGKIIPPARTEDLGAFFRQNLFAEHATVELVPRRSMKKAWKLRQAETYCGAVASSEAQKFAQKLASNYVDENHRVSRPSRSK